MTENWRPVSGYEGRYEVSDLGRIRSIPRLDSRGRRVRLRIRNRARKDARNVRRREKRRIARQEREVA